MKFRLIPFLLMLISVQGAMAAVMPDDDQPVSPGRRSFLLRPAYTWQDNLNFIELGLGRINSANSAERSGPKKLMYASYDFTLGMGVGFGDSTPVFVPHMAFEASAVLLGARVSYQYAMQDERRTGVIGIEGGLCILSRFFAYAGYNFVKSPDEQSVFQPGPKISVGLLFPFGGTDIAPAKRPTHLI